MLCQLHLKKKKKPGVLQSMGSQRVRHNQGTELNWLKAAIKKKNTKKKEYSVATKITWNQPPFHVQYLHLANTTHTHTY